MGKNNHKIAMGHIIDGEIYNMELSRDFINFVAMNNPSILNSFMNQKFPKRDVVFTDFNTIMVQNNWGNRPY